ncbi:hypothetical protein ACP4OV_026778 [Aristida adscensionis]
MEQQLLYVVLWCGFFTLVMGWLLRFSHRWMNPPCHNGRLPPGSMGLPIVGETFQFLKPSQSLDIADLYKLRLERYGPLFKTSLVGRPVVVSMDMKVNHFIFRHEEKLFQFWYPDSINSLFGKKSIAILSGSIHKYFRSITALHFSPNYLKEVFIIDMESVVTETLRKWATKCSIEVKESITNMMFDLIAKNLIGFEPASQRTKELRENFAKFFQGLISFPLYLPGTKFYGSMQGRKYIRKELKDLLKQRVSASERRHGDFLDILVEELQSENALVHENFMVDVLVGLIFASTASIPTMLTIGMKLLTDNPNVVEALREEHEAIVKERAETDSRITWEEFKSMKFTTQVINEIARLSSNGPGIFRKTMKDVQVNGYTIPAGWLVMISPTAVHLNPELFQDPLTFNPWRWQEANGSSLMRNFIPFGDGKRHCLGAEFSKLQIAVFLHTLVTKYRWKEIRGGGDMFRVSEVLFPQGYHIQISPRS